MAHRHPVQPGRRLVPAAAPGSKDKDAEAVPAGRRVEDRQCTHRGPNPPVGIGGIHVFTADFKYRTKNDGEPEGKITWQKYSVDDKADPKTLDIVITDDTGKVGTWRWLYRIDGDKLEYCHRADDPTVLPKKFEARRAPRM